MNAVANAVASAVNCAFERLYVRMNPPFLFMRDPESDVARSSQNYHAILFYNI